MIRCVRLLRHRTIQSLHQPTSSPFKRLRSFSTQSLRPPSITDLQYFQSILSPNQILTTLDGSSASQEIDPYNRDWTGRYRGHSALVLKPSSTKAVSDILAHCHAHRIGLVPRGGNTGLCGGATPASDEIVLSLEHMNAIHRLDTHSGIVVADAGCILQNLHEHASDKGYLFPLDIGSKGSCMIGGNVATNAGGGYFYRWGGLHSNVVGLEVVLPDGGRVLRLNLEDNGIERSLYTGCHRKDNTGYDLKHLFIGSEGTLGIITKVAVACPTLPSSKHAVMLVCDNYSSVLEVLTCAKEELGEILSACELIDWQTLMLVRENLPGEAALLDEMLNEDATTSPSSASQSPLYILVEAQGSNSQHDSEKMDNFLTRLYESSTIANGFLATDSTRINSLWNIREACNPSVARSGYVYKYDVSVPIEEYMDVAVEVKGILSKEMTLPESIVCVWGHLADGNAHINVVTPGQFHKDEVMASLVDDSVYGSVLRRKGSISAEHGIGQSKREILERVKDEGVLDVMAQMKRMFDPHGILNPGKVLPTKTMCERVFTQKHGTYRTFDF